MADETQARGTTGRGKAPSAPVPPDGIDASPAAGARGDAAPRQATPGAGDGGSTAAMASLAAGAAACLALLVPVAGAAIAPPVAIVAILCGAMAVSGRREGSGAHGQGVAGIALGVAAWGISTMLLVLAVAVSSTLGAASLLGRRGIDVVPDAIVDYGEQGPHDYGYDLDDYGYGLDDYGYDLDDYGYDLDDYGHGHGIPDIEPYELDADELDDHEIKVTPRGVMPDEIGVPRLAPMQTDGAVAG